MVGRHLMTEKRAVPNLATHAGRLRVRLVLFGALFALAEVVGSFGLFAPGISTLTIVSLTAAVVGGLIAFRSPLGWRSRTIAVILLGTLAVAIVLNLTGVVDSSSTSSSTVPVG